MTRDAFEALVAEALDQIPPALGAEMENVVVLVDDRVRPGHLLGLYEGVPLTERGISYSAVGPDRITIYMSAICAACETVDEVADMVRRTVLHEVGHHFGIDDRRLEELGWG